MPCVHPGYKCILVVRRGTSARREESSSWVGTFKATLRLWRKEKECVMPRRPSANHLNKSWFRVPSLNKPQRVLGHRWPMVSYLQSWHNAENLSITTYSPLKAPPRAKISHHGPSHSSEKEPHSHTTHG